MTRGRLWTELLAWGAEATRSDRFAPLHASVRRFYLSGVLPAAALAFRRALKPEGATLIPRCSVLVSRDFRALESDLDVSLVLEDGASAEAVAKGRGLHAAIKRRLPFFGELEIYERREMRVKESLVAAAGPVLDMLWLLRKWRWQGDRLMSAPSLYHRRKAERSIRKLQDRLGLKDVDLLPGERDGRRIGARIEELTRFLPRREPDGPIAASAGFLEWELHSAENRTDRTGAFRLNCTGAGALTLLSILPDAEFICERARDAVAELRRSPAIRETLLAVTLSEWVLLRSVERTSPESETEKRAAWRGRLERLMRASAGSHLLRDLPEFSA